MARHKYHTYFDGKKVLHKLKGMNKTEVAVKLYPYYEDRTAAYHHLKEQIVAGSMPTDKYEEMMRIINETDCKKSSHIHYGARNSKAHV